MTIRVLTAEEQSLLMQAVIEKQMHEATVAIDLRVPNAAARKLDPLYNLLRASQLCVIES